VQRALSKPLQLSRHEKASVYSAGFFLYDSMIALSFFCSKRLATPINMQLATIAGLHCPM